MTFLDPFAVCQFPGPFFLYIFLIGLALVVTPGLFGRVSFLVFGQSDYQHLDY